MAGGTGRSRQATDSTVLYSISDLPKHDLDGLMVTGPNTALQESAWGGTVL